MGTPMKRVQVQDFGKCRKQLSLRCLAAALLMLVAGLSGCRSAVEDVEDRVLPGRGTGPSSGTVNMVSTWKTIGRLASSRIEPNKTPTIAPYISANHLANTSG